MRRCYFYLNDVDHKAILRKLEGEKVGFSEFVRQALVEKLDREAVIGHATQVREDLDALVRELRQEIGRTRRDLMDDHARGLELVRQEVAKSMKKNEELQKAFVMALAGQAQPSKSSRAAPSEDGPMRIPG